MDFGILGGSEGFPGASVVKKTYLPMQEMQETWV